MASTYSELKSEIASYVLRAESEMPLATFISLAEAELQPLITHYEQEKTVTLTSVGNDVTLPADFIEARRYAIDGNPLTPVSIYGFTLSDGEIGYFQNGKAIQLVNASGANVDVEITYRARFTPLSNSNPTNWLLTKFPTVYHHAAMAKAYHWLKDQPAEQGKIAALQNALSTVAEDNRQYENGGNQLRMEGMVW